MQIVRSASAVLAGFVVFVLLFAVLGGGLGLVLAAIAGGLMAGYVTAKIIQSRELAHGGAAAGLAAGYLLLAPLPAPTGAMLAVIAALAVTGGAWVRGQARTIGSQS
jgi:hypothetical protein